MVPEEDMSRMQQRSKYHSLVLRHRPEVIGIELDANGWVEVEVLLSALAQHQKGLTRRELIELVETNDKQRFAFSKNGVRIRASQGHSKDIDLGYTPEAPPDVLYHGTADRNLASIQEKGLVKGNRHHVHLSTNRDTATAVGKRYGRPMIVEVDAKGMHTAGHAFFVSENGVWLTDRLPPEFIYAINRL
jgi:putative RNA 2'-phosphotransferase